MRVFFIILLLALLFGALINWGYLKDNLKRTISHFKLIHYAWIILFIAILNFGKIQSTNIMATNSVQLVLVFFAGAIIGFSLLTRLNYAFSSIKTPLFCLIMYGFSGVLSGAISPFPEFSLYKALLILIGTTACMLFLSYRPQYNYTSAALDLSILFYWIMFLSFLLGAIISPEKTFIKQITGMNFAMLYGWIIVTNPNSVGVISGVIALISLNKVMGTPSIRVKFFHLTASLVSITVLIIAQSRTCIIGFAASFALLLMKQKLRYLMFFFIITITVFVCLGTDMLKNDAEQYFRRGQTDKQYKTWSGRLPAWQHSWRRFKDKPILGYGMAAGVRYGAVSKSLIGSHLHSSYFEVLLNSGLIGFIPWLICFFILMSKILKIFFFIPEWFTPLMKERHKEITAILFFLFIRSLAGTTFVNFDHSLMLFIALIAYETSIRNENYCTLPENNLLY